MVAGSSGLPGDPFSVDQRQPMFHDPTRQREFDRLGYTILPLLGSDEVATLRSSFGDVQGLLPSTGFRSSSHASDVTVRCRVRQGIATVLAPRLDEILQPYRVLNAAYLYKAGKESAVSPHQEYTIADESRYVVANVWVALSEMGPENGPLSVVPGSHRVFPGLRAPTIPGAFHPEDELVRSRGIPLHVSAGTAIVLDSPLVHFSTPNLSSAVRLAAVATVTSAGASVRFYYRPPGLQGVVEEFEMEDDFLSQFEDFHTELNLRPRRGRSLGLVPFEPAVREPAEVARRLDLAARLAADP